MNANMNNRGFTLIELLVVVMIMAILATIVMGLGGYASRKAAEGRAKADLQNLRSALEEFRLDRGYSPGYLAYREQLPTEIPITELPGEDMDKLLEIASNRMAGVELSFRDPWARPYRYRLTGRYAYRLRSTGPRGEEEEYDDIE